MLTSKYNNCHTYKWASGAVAVPIRSKSRVLSDSDFVGHRVIGGLNRAASFPVRGYHLPTPTHLPKDAQHSNTDRAITGVV